MNRTLPVAAFVAFCFAAAATPARAADWAWVERTHIEEAGRTAELWVLGDEAPAPTPRALVHAELDDHLIFSRLVGVERLLSANFAAGLVGEIEIAEEQSLIEVAASVPPPVSTGPVSEDARALAHVEADRLLGDGNEEQRLQALLPFTRQRGVSGVIVGGSLAASAAAAGVPMPAMLELLEALGTAVYFERDIRNGDRMYVRYEQAFTAEGAALDIGRVLWAELRTAKGTIAVHRYRGRDRSERFWLSSGQAATPPSVRLPLDVVAISSGFGLRADPFDQPPAMYGGKPDPMGGPLRNKPLPPGLPTGGALDMPRGGTSSSLGAPPPGLSSYGGPKAAAYSAPARRTRALFMHEGVDLVAPSGTPIYAAADGIIVGAAPNGRYGNWIRIDHGGKLTTVYGHLAGFAPDIKPGTLVSRGDLIGFVGSTGRSTGAHLHFELLSDGKPVNPITHPELKRTVLRGPEMDRFRKQVAASAAERDREALTVVSDVD